MRTKQICARRMFGDVGRNCVLVLAFVGLVFTNSLAAQNADPKPVLPHGIAVGPRIWLAESRELRVQHTGATPREQELARSVAARNGVPLAIARGDFDGDGIDDLLVGYATPAGGAIVLHRGNIDAFAPLSEDSFQAIGRGEFPQPFLTGAAVFEVPVRPDFIAVGDFTGMGRLDLAVAGLGGKSVYVFPGVAGGKFGTPQQIQLGGSAVTTLAAGNLRIGSGSFTNVLVGLSSSTNKHSLMILGGTEMGLTVVATLPLTERASNIHFGDFGDAHLDAAFLAGSEVVLLHSSSLRLEPLSLPVSALSIDLGSFVYDRNSQLQIAVLDTTGGVHIVAHNEFDPHVRSLDELAAIRQAARRGYANPLIAPREPSQNGWKVIESLPGLANMSGAQPPAFFTTRISDHNGDDILVIDPSTAQLHVIAHPNGIFGAATFPAAEVSRRPYNGSPVAAISARVNIDGRPGIIAMHSGETAPSVMMPLPDPTFFVNRTDDPAPGAIASTCNNVNNTDTSSSCSLREAILKANSTAGTDTIMVAAGTYTLSIARQAGDNTGAHGGLYVNDSVNIVGAGQAFTIIQGGTSAATGVDLVMAVNEDIQTITNASASLSNLTIRFGRNRGSVAGFDGDGGCMEFDTGSSGNATLTLTNVTLSNCVTTDGNGGGIAIFNASSGSGGTGLATITNSILQNNSVAEVNAGSAGSGGGLWVADLARMSMSNSQVINNSATQVNGSGRGVGGGVFIFSAGSGSRQTQIHGSTISGNSASGAGGGVWSASNLLIDNAGAVSIVSGNSAGANGGGSQVGGGISLNTAPPDATTITKTTITGNTATGNGGGIASGRKMGGGPLTLTFSRVAGNTAPAGQNIDNIQTTITAANNWWGTNTPASTIANSSSTTTFDPFIQLTNAASPATIKINQSATLTADMSKDNHGSGAALAGNLDVLAGLAITFNNAILGSIPQAQPEALNSSALATATFNAGGTGGTGHADATVDQQTVTANINILEPLQITKSFGPTTVVVNASSTLTFSANNPNGIGVDASFTDSLPAGLVVASTPAVTNTCGGTVTAAAGAGSVSFSNASLPVGVCAITVAVRAAADGVLNNSVTINSTAAGTGPQSTSNATLTAINPPAIGKAFGAASVPLNGTTSLTLTLTSTNANLTLNGVAFTDNLPAGLVVATPSALTSTCTGTATAASGSSSVSLSGANLAPGASCTVSVNVAATTAGVKNNSTQVSSTNGGTGNTSNASITVLGPPVIIKAFGAASIPLNGSTSLSFTIQNNNTTTTLTGIAFSDTFPAGLTVATPNGLTGSCGGGKITATQGTNSVSLSGASLAASTSCTFSVNTTGTAAGTKNNITGTVVSTEGGTGGTALASIKVEAPPTIAKGFAPSTISLNATTSLTFTVTNPAGNPDPLTGVGFTDTLPTGLTVANASATVCGGTLTTTAPTGIALSGATIAVNSQCQFSVTVTGGASGQYTNTTGNVTSTNGGTGNIATANLTVATPPSILKAFGASSAPLGGTTSLTFTMQNPNTTLPLTGVTFTDTLPAGLVVATPNNLSSTCGGTATALVGASSVSLSGGALAANASCAVSLNVTGTTPGLKNNSVAVTSTEGGTGNTSNASITIVGAPVLIKAFGAASIPLNGSTSLSFTVQNNNATSGITGVGFGDTLPAGLVVSTPNGLTGSCGGGTITATQGANSVSLSGASLAASTSCTFSINVTGTTAGTKNDTSGNVTSTEGGAGGTASASLKVEAQPSIAKTFNPSGVALNATTLLTFTVTNPAGNPDPLTGVAFTDTLPAGLTVANASATVCGGTLTTTAPTGIALSGATIAVNSQCQFSVTVTGGASGQYTNTTGNVTSTNGGTGNTATANLTVATPPSILKAFGAASIPLNGSTSLSFTIGNPAINAFPLTGIAFTDNLPAGLVVAASPNLSNTCGGTATAVGGASIVSLTGGTIASGASCTVSVTVSGSSAGVKNNSVSVTSTAGGAGNTSNASITVNAPPTIVKTFGAASIPVHGSTSLSFAIQNNNTTTPLGGVGFTDTLPAGLAISTPNGLTGSCGGGTITATQAANTVSLSVATLPPSGSCTFSVNVTGIVAGTQNNTTGNVTSTQGGTGGTASASVNVVGAPSIVKAFSPATVPPGTNSTLSFTITNPAANAVALAGVAFTDTLPGGLTVATPNGLTGSCGGGTITSAAGSGSIALSGGTIATNGSCTFSVNVAGPAGNYTNTTGSVTSTNGGTGNTATANLTVGAPPSIAKSFGAASVGLAGSTTLTFTITNPNSSLALNGVVFNDSLPSGLVVSIPNGLTGACGGGTITANAGSQNIALAGGTIAPGGSCAFAVNVTGISAGNQVNTTGNVVAANGGTGNTATASISVLAPDLAISKKHTGSFFQGQTNASYSIAVNNVGAGPTAGAVIVNEIPPSGLTVTGLAGTGWTCNLGSLSCTRSDALAAGASYPTITVTASVATNAPPNVTNSATVSGGGELNVANDAASDLTTISLPPDFTLSATPATITIRAGNTASYVVTVTPQNSAFTSPINFAATGLPAKTTFLPNPASVTPGANPATATLFVVTTAGDPFLAENFSVSHGPLFTFLLPISGLLISGLGLRKRRWRRGKAGWLLVTLMLVSCGFVLNGCASARNFQNLGTPPGSYTVTITAFSGATQHSAPVTLVVQP